MTTDTEGAADNIDAFVAPDVTAVLLDMDELDLIYTALAHLSSFDAGWTLLDKLDRAYARLQERKGLA